MAPWKISKRSVVVVVALAPVLALVGSASAQDGSIPWGGTTVLPDYAGAPAKAHPTANTGVPQNPYLAPNPFNSVHTSGSDTKPPRIWLLNRATARYPYTDVEYAELGQGELIRNTFAVTKAGVERSAAYAVTSAQMYRVDGADLHHGQGIRLAERRIRLLLDCARYPHRPDGLEEAGRHGRQF